MRTAMAWCLVALTATAQEWSLFSFSETGRFSESPVTEEISNEYYKKKYPWEPRHFDCLVYGFPSCGACRSWERLYEDAVKKGGLQVSHHNVHKSPVPGVALCPTIVLRRWDGKKYHEEQRWIGVTSASEILREMRSVIKRLNASDEDRSGGEPGSFYLEERASSTNSEGGVQRRRSVYSQSGQVPDEVQRETVEETVAVTEYVRQKVPGTGWNEGRSACGNPSCSMCYSQYRMVPVTSYKTVQKPRGPPDQPDNNPAQAPTPAATLTRMLAFLGLSSRDHLADIGCGDGRVLIEAAQTYGCTGIGIEIDERKVIQARQNVSDAGLENKIRIIHGDAIEFFPEEHGVTAVTAYLYPDLLSEISMNLRGIQKIASPFHEIPGLGMRQYSDVWVLRN